MIGYTLVRYAVGPDGGCRNAVILLMDMDPVEAGYRLAAIDDHRDLSEIVSDCRAVYYVIYDDVGCATHYSVQGAAVGWVPPMTIPNEYVEVPE